MAESVKTIKKYETLYAIRTGLTVLLPKNELFDDKPEAGFSFTVEGGEVVVTGGKIKAILAGLKKEILEACVSKGFIMFYETDSEDEVIRNTICRYKK